MCIVSVSKYMYVTWLDSLSCLSVDQTVTTSNHIAALFSKHKCVLFTAVTNAWEPGLIFIANYWHYHDTTGQDSLIGEVSPNCGPRCVHGFHKVVLPPCVWLWHHSYIVTDTCDRHRHCVQAALNHSSLLLIKKCWIMSYKFIENLFVDEIQLM